MRCLALGILCFVVAVAGGCRRKEADDPTVLRLGYFANATHAQALVGVREGAFEDALSAQGVKLEPRVFNAGPAAMEALLSGSVDATYVGLGPALNAFVQSKGELRIVAAAADGGAALYLREGASLDALEGLRFAVPQIGNSQDIALRHYLRTRGLDPARAVTIFTVPNPEIVGLFRRGELDGAWVPEPWGVHLEGAGAYLALDEAETWPQRRFHTTVLVVSRRALDRKRPQLEALVRVHEALTARWRKDPAAFTRAVGEAFAAQVGAPMEPHVLARAFERLEPALHPDPEVIAHAAERARGVGYLQRNAELEGVVDDSLLSPSHTNALPAGR